MKRHARAWFPVLLLTALLSILVVAGNTGCSALGQWLGTSERYQQAAQRATTNPIVIAAETSLPYGKIAGGAAGAILAGWLIVNRVLRRAQTAQATP